MAQIFSNLIKKNKEESATESSVKFSNAPDTKPPEKQRTSMHQVASTMHKQMTMGKGKTLNKKLKSKMEKR